MRSYIWFTITEVFRLEKRASTSDMRQTTSTAPMTDTSLPLLGVLQHPSSMSSQLHLKRLHRKSTVSCDANFATLSGGADKSSTPDSARTLTPSLDQIEPFRSFFFNSRFYLLVEYWIFLQCLLVHLIYMYSLRTFFDSTFFLTYRLGFFILINLSYILDVFILLNSFSHPKTDQNQSLLKIARFGELKKLNLVRYYKLFHSVL